MTNAVLSRDPKGNFTAIQMFSGLPANLDLVLRPGITLSGCVKDTNGAPMREASAKLSFGIRNSFWEPGSGPVKADERGFFANPALPRGKISGLIAKSPPPATARFWRNSRQRIRRPGVANFRPLC